MDNHKDKPTEQSKPTSPPGRPDQGAGQPPIAGGAASRRPDAPVQGGQDDSTREANETARKQRGMQVYGLNKPPCKPAPEEPHSETVPAPVQPPAESPTPLLPAAASEEPAEVGPQTPGEAKPADEGPPALPAEAEPAREEPKTPEAEAVKPPEQAEELAATGVGTEQTDLPLETTPDVPPEAPALVPAVAEEKPPAPPKPSPDLEALRVGAWNTEQAEKEQDQKDLEQRHKEMMLWHDRVSALRESVATTAEEFNRVVAESRSKVQSAIGQLPPETQESFNRQQTGMDLVAKMLRQQVDRVGTFLPLEEEPAVELPVFGEQSWRDLVGEVADGDPDATIQKKQKDIQRKLKELGQKRYQVMAQVHETQEKHRKSFLRFVGKQLLPVLDSIDAGEEHSRTQIEKLKADHPDAASQIEGWLKTYGVLRDKLLEVLEKVQVQHMEVDIGGKVQYDRHEPFGTEADPAREDETIVSVAREGYTYKSVDGGEFVLRPAQVIVIKNERQERAAANASG